MPSARNSCGRALARLFVIVSAMLAAAGSAPGQGTEEPAASAAPEASDAARSAAFQRLGPRYQQWLVAVRGLITQAELDYFLGLTEDFRRDAFMEAFWGPRDPDPATAQNELRERWEEYRRSSPNLPYGDPRFLLLLLNGPPGGWNLPNGQPVGRCFSRSSELEIWFYGGSERLDQRFLVILLRRGVDAPYEVFRPGGTLRPVLRTGGLPTNDIRLLCADDLLRYALSEIGRRGDYERVLGQVLAPPLPSAEWLASFSASATDLPAGAETFAVAAELSFPFRRQSRTGVRVLVAVPLDQAPGRRFDGQLFHDFQLVGEVIRDGRLFESFRYRFNGPTPEGVARIPLGFVRYLRPGAASLRLRIEDVYSGRFAHVVEELDVPAPEGLPEAPEAAVPAADEAPPVRLVTPPGEVQTGLVRFHALTAAGIDKVAFFLDDRPVLSKTRPPFSVELDLGKDAVPHQVRAVGYAGEREVASDRVWLNQGGQRFRVELVEPRSGGIYPGSVTARVEVATPGAETVDRVELYVNDRSVATLRQAPYVQALELPEDGTAVVRAVAYLDDGTAAEDAVVVNGAAFGAAIEVRLVELPVLVVDAEGDPIRDLGGERFRVFDAGVRQQIERFEPAGAAPLTALLLVDRSASMAPHLEAVSQAALAFARAARRSTEDRLGVASFADRLSVDAPLGAGDGAVERALAGLTAAGGTALYDSLVESFQRLSEGRGVGAVVLFSDGRDENSALSFEQTLAAARRAEVVLYAVGLAASFPDRESRRGLEELTAETGGSALFLDDLGEVEEAYRGILEELRSRYLLAYQPTSAGPEPHTVRVEVDVPGARVRTRRGYTP